jgi:hypothetical protein
MIEDLLFTFILPPNRTRAFAITVCLLHPVLLVADKRYLLGLVFSPTFLLLLHSIINPRHGSAPPAFVCSEKDAVRSLFMLPVFFLPEHSNIMFCYIKRNYILTFVYIYVASSKL